MGAGASLPTGYASDLFADGTFKTQIARRVSLNDAVDGIEAYINDMTAGKTLICP